MGSLLKHITEKENSVKRIEQTRFEFYWFVFYTYPRVEKVVYKELMNKDYNVFLPMTKTLKAWNSAKRN